MVKKPLLKISSRSTPTTTATIDNRKKRQISLQTTATTTTMTTNCSRSVSNHNFFTSPAGIILANIMHDMKPYFIKMLIISIKIKQKISNPIFDALRVSPVCTTCWSLHQRKAINPPKLQQWRTEAIKAMCRCTLQALHPTKEMIAM